MALSSEDYVKLAAHVLHVLPGSLRSAEIASAALEQSMLRELRRSGLDLDPGTDPIDLARRIGQAIKNHISRTSARQLIITGTKNGGWQLGNRAIKSLTGSDAYSKPHNSTYTGLCGEYAVMSELLHCEWNATKLPEDNGIDILAKKGDEIRTVQVKTSHPSGGDPERYDFQLHKRVESVHGGIRHYSILVMRRPIARRWINDYLILAGRDLQEFDHDGVITSTSDGRWLISMTIEGEAYMANGARDLRDRVNNFKRNFL